MRLYTYSDIYSRKHLLEQTADKDERKAFERALSLYNLNKTESNALSVMEAMTISPWLCRTHYALAENFVKKYKDIRIKRIFEDAVIPASDISNVEGLDGIEGLDTEAIANKITQNMAIDRLIDNDENINKTGKLDDFIANTLNPAFSAMKVAEAVDKFNIPLHGKVVIAIEEAMYLLDKHGKKYDDNTVIETAMNYFRTYPITDKDKKNINYGITHNILTEEYNFDDTLPPDKFANSEDKSCTEADNMISFCFTVYPYQFVETVKKVLSIIRFNIIAKHNPELTHYMINVAVPKLIDGIMSSKLCTDYKFKDILFNTSKIIEMEIMTLTQMIKNGVERTDEVTQHNIASYITKLTELQARIDDIYKDITPCENRQCEEAYINTAKSISLINFENNFKNDILENATYANEFIKTRCLGMTGLVVRDDIKNINEASTYDMISTDDHIVDYVFGEAYIYTNYNESVKYLNTLCNSINESKLKFLDQCCYFTLNEATAYLHIRSNMKIMLTSVEEATLNDHITIEDEFIIESLNNLCDINSTNFSAREVIDAFSESYNDELFNYFIEFCEYANIDTNEINKVYKAVNSSDKFRSLTESTNSIRKYEPKNAPMEIQLEAVRVLNDILTEAKDAKALSKKLKTNATKAKTKATSAVHEPEKGKNPAGNSDEHPLKNKLNNFTLILKGFSKKIKDLSSKEQNAAKNADAAFRQFAKSANNAIIGDRKEAIIKGQVIPSFSKMVKYGIAVAGIGLVNPIAAGLTLIAGIAASKHIDKKVKVDLMDEIEVELQIVDKEIANAENRGQIKKQRALLMTKKQMQRTYQRIKYNTKLGKDIIPAGYAVPDFGNE